MADQDLEMFAVIGKIAAALSQSAGHTVEVYKAEESIHFLYSSLSNYNHLLHFHFLTPMGE